MKFRYRLPFKTRLLLFLMRPFRSRSVERPTAAELARARKDVPNMFPFLWALGRVPKGISVENRKIPVRDAEIGVRIYRPQVQGPLPLIMNYHGGGWAVGTLQNNDYYCGVLADRVGAVVVSVDYRLAPEHKFPTAVYDAYDALSWATAHARELGVDVTRVCVTGDSAGGNLAAVVAMLSRDLGGPAVHFQALIYPATDSRLQYPSFELHAEAPILRKVDILNYLAMYMRDEADRSSPLLSPYLAASLQGLAPAVVVTAGYDPLCDDGQQYAQRLQAEGVATELLHYPEDIHGFFTLPNPTQSGKEAIEVVAQRIRQALRG